jgi:hypothetical protein
MTAISILLWLAAFGMFLLRKNNQNRSDAAALAEARNEFAKRVKYIRFLETVPPAKCERCNHKKRLRGVLTLARLCRPCQDELGLTRQVYGGL